MFDNLQKLGKIDKALGNINTDQLIAVGKLAIKVLQTPDAKKFFAPLLATPEGIELVKEAEKLGKK
jgi:hypothetical protein